MALFWRIWGAVTLVTLAVLAIFVVLASLQFASINADLVGERLLVLAGRTAAPFKAAAGLGLPLSAVRNADALLEGARQSDDAILAIHVFDAEGRIVRSTANPAGGAIPGEAAAARAEELGAPWYRETGEGFLSSIDIAARNGQSVGGILIVYPGGGSQTQVRAMAAELALGAAGILVVSAALSGLLLRLGLAPQIRVFQGVESAISTFERRSWRAPPGKQSDPGPAGRESGRGSETGELSELLEAAEARYRRAVEASEGREGGPR